MSDRDYYQVLGVTRKASPAELRAAYVRLLKRHHPDAAQPRASLPQRLRDIQTAYRCLSQPTTRAAHDRDLTSRERAHFQSQRAVRRSLRRYDRRYPQPALPRPPVRRKPWRALLAAALGAALAAQLSLRLLG